VRERLGEEDRQEESPERLREEAREERLGEESPERRVSKVEELSKRLSGNTMQSNIGT
jgi:hypothetical protein